MSRYLALQAQGLAQWLGRPPTSPVQRVYLGLLHLPRSAPLAPARLAERFGLELPDFSRALFELNRSASLQVCETEEDHSAEYAADHALLCAELGRLAGPAPALLAGNDGLCLAQQGLTEAAGTEEAARCHQGPSRDFPCVMPLYLDLGGRPIHLCSPQPIDATSTALLRLARRLIGLQQPGPLAA